MIVLLKRILALFDVIVLLPMRMTGFENVRGLAPETVMFAPICVEAALLKVRFVGGADPPTIPENITVPDAPGVSVRF